MRTYMSFARSLTVPLTIFPRTTRRTVAPLSAALHSSGRLISRARQGPRSSPSCAADPSHPSRTTSKRAGRHAGPAEAVPALNHQFGRYRSPWRHRGITAIEASCEMQALFARTPHSTQHNVSRPAHKWWRRRTKCCGNPAVSAACGQQGKRTGTDRAAVISLPTTR